jgi:hypothetical protein
LITADVGELDPASSKRKPPALFNEANVLPESEVLRISAPSLLDPAATKAVVAEDAPTPVQAAAMSPGRDQVAAAVVATAKVVARMADFMLGRGGEGKTTRKR